MYQYTTRTHNPRALALGVGARLYKAGAPTFHERGRRLPEPKLSKAAAKAALLAWRPPPPPEEGAWEVVATDAEGVAAVRRCRLTSG